MTYPLEDEEQAVVVEYLDRLKFPRFRVPNETFTRSWKQKMKNKRLGVSAGAPDLFAIITTPNGSELVAIEMKRQKGARPTTSASQKKWQKDLRNAGIRAEICFGADEAIKLIDDLRKGKRKEWQSDKQDF